MCMVKNGLLLSLVWWITTCVCKNCSPLYFFVDLCHSKIFHICSWKATLLASQLRTFKCLHWNIEIFGRQQCRITPHPTSTQGTCVSFIIFFLVTSTLSCRIKARQCSNCPGVLHWSMPFLKLSSLKGNTVSFTQTQLKTLKHLSWNTESFVRQYCRITPHPISA